MISLAPKAYCTACGACGVVCPKQCIRMEEDEVGLVYPHIDIAMCVECHSCERVCPVLHPLVFRTPRRAYAAWSTNAEERRTSASGGIAAELYKEAWRRGSFCAGACQQPDFSVSFELSACADTLFRFKNSKYVFSEAWDVFRKMKPLLKEGKEVLFIGLPCQVAAARRLFRDAPNLVLVDVVCHGITPYSYLRQHIKTLEGILQKRAVNMSFRDYYLHTYTYTFTLYDANGERFYAGRISDGDLYQYGYHRMVSYRENCYHCSFARSERLSDLTLSDYKGLGKMGKPVTFDENEVSCVLVHTERGQKAMNRLIESRAIVATERPLKEPIKADPQLQHPSRKSRARREFERQIILTRGDFEIAIQRVLAREEKFRVWDLGLAFPRRMAGKIKRFILRKIHRK